MMQRIQILLIFALLVLLQPSYALLGKKNKQDDVTVTFGRGKHVKKGDLKKYEFSKSQDSLLFLKKSLVQQNLMDQLLGDSYLIMDERWKQWLVDSNDTFKSVRSGVRARGIHSRQFLDVFQSWFDQPSDTQDWFMKGHPDYFGYSMLEDRMTIYATIGSEYSPSAIELVPVNHTNNQTRYDRYDKTILDYDLSLRDGTKIGELCVVLMDERHELELEIYMKLPSAVDRKVLYK